jgi:succinate dehydrogenase/fumarate reductase flavoprotein subunit
MSRKRTKADRLGRRDFVKLAGAGAVGGALLPVVPLAQSTAHARGFERNAEVVVVGSGAAGLSAAITAHEFGSRVVILEKAPNVGGTTLKSGGVYWIPNNALMRAAGLTDPRRDAIRYMARLAYPQLYDPGDARFGLPDNEFELIAAFYDNASPAIEFLETVGALRSKSYLDFTGQFFPDYFSELPENVAPRGRGLRPRRDDGGDGFGFDLVQQLKTAVDERGIEILLDTRVERLVRTERGRIAGLEARRPSGQLLSIGARRSVVFASGGFSQNAELRRSFLRGPIYGGCAVPTNQGDLIGIAGGLGAKLANMNEAWYYQVVLEEALDLSSVPVGVFFNTGDSMVAVNKFGRRVVNEKIMYNERARVHFAWDPVRAEYTNLLLFFIYDQRTADIFQGFGGPGGPIPPQNQAPFVLSGQAFGDLAAAIQNRLTELAGQTGDFRLDDSFAENLRDTVATFNGYAQDGVDPKFARGETPAELALHGPARPGNDLPNPTMFPLSADGPYYCIILGAGALDTHGGPKIDRRARLLDHRDRPIRGLYGAGNCISSPAGQAYWSAGGTLGPAITFGFIAGKEATDGPR